MANGLLMQVGIDASDAVSGIDGLMSKFAGLGVAIAAVAYVISQLKISIDAADALDELAESTGASVRELVALQHAMELAGAGSDGAEKALTKVKNLQYGLQTGSKGAAETMSKLGLDLNALKNKAPYDAITILSEAIENLGTETERTAMAQEIFGAKASRMKNLNTAGLKAAAAATADLGEVMEKNGKTSADWNDSISELGVAWKSFWAGAVSAITPAIIGLTAIANGLSKIISYSEMGRIAMEGLMAMPGAGQLIMLLGILASKYKASADAKKEAEAKKAEEEANKPKKDKRDPYTFEERMAELKAEEKKAEEEKKKKEEEEKKKKEKEDFGYWNPNMKPGALFSSSLATIAGGGGVVMGGGMDMVSQQQKTNEILTEIKKNTTPTDSKKTGGLK